MLRFLLAGLLAVSLAAPAAAQDTTCKRRKVLVCAMDKQGHTIAGLTQQNFKAKFRGKPAQIVDVRPFTTAPRIVIVLDASGSMADLWAHASVIAAHLPFAFREQERLALVIFNNKVTHEKGFGTPRQELVDLLRALQPAKAKKSNVKGRTSLHLGLLRAVEMLRPALPGDVIYLISDGGTDNRSGIGDQRVERTLLVTGIRFFAVVAVHPDSRFRIVSEEGVAYLERLSETTGGAFLSVTPIFSAGSAPSKQENELTGALYWLYRQIWELYEVEVELPLDVDKPREWKLELNPPPGVKKSGSQLSYPQKLLPCAQP